ncbi:MAG: DNA polymerase III subunit delta [Flavobacteriales bacterium]|nr:DNA polymerase III subunit delta [Flavobacteriales bacterium]
MTAKTFKSLLNDIRKRSFEPIYFLEGEEPYFIDRIADELEKTVLTESEKSFNLQILYGRDIKLIDVVSSARRFPMMAEYQLIIVREAQHIRKFDELLPYLENPVPSTVLVFLYKGKKINKSAKVGRELKKYGLLTTKVLYDREISSWMNSHISTLGLTVEPQALQLLVQNAGTNLHQIAGELDKIKANMEGRTEITLDDVSRHTGLDKEYNIFELTRSLGEKNRTKTLRIVKHFAANPKDNPFVLVLSNIYNYFRKVHLVHFSKTVNQGELASVLGLNPYFVPEYLNAARRYSAMEMTQVFKVIHEFDLRSKGMGGGHSDENELLTELVVRIMK